MPPYAYPIVIKKDPQLIRYNREVEIESDVLTLEIVTENIKPGELFSVHQKDGGMFGGPHFLSIVGERLETPEEVAIRVEKEEKYMAEYNKRQAKKTL